MVRNFEELNKLEQKGLRTILKEDGWEYCTLHSIKDEKTIPSLTKKMGDKNITIKIKHFCIDED